VRNQATPACDFCPPHLFTPAVKEIVWTLDKKHFLWVCEEHSDPARLR
jgi:hypothetical protein